MNWHTAYFFVFWGHTWKSLLSENKNVWSSKKSIHCCNFDVFLHSLPVQLPHLDGWEKAFNSIIKKSAKFLGCTCILANLQLAKQLCRIRNKKASEQPLTMSETEEWNSDTEVLSPPFSAGHRSSATAESLDTLVLASFHLPLGWVCF